MKIRFKLFLGFGIITFLLIIVGYAGHYGVNQIFESFDVIADETAPELSILGEIDALSNKLQVEALGHFTIQTDHNTPEALEEHEEFEKTNLRLDQKLDELRILQRVQDLPREEEDREGVLLDELLVAKAELYSISLKFIEISDSGYDPQTIFSLKEELEQAEEKMENIISQRINDEKNELERRDNIADQLSIDISNFVVSISIFGVILATVLGVITSGRIVKPIINLRNITKEIALGNFSIRTKVEGNDEISQLASDVNAMADSLSKQKEELIKNERISALGHVTSRLAHNLKNPLSVVRATTGIIEATSQNSVDKKTKERLNQIKTSIENMLNQIEDILDFVKQKPLELKDVLLSEILNTALNNIKKPDGIKINLPEKDIMIKCDEAKLQVVFMNMITNSIEAVEENGEITIASFQSERENTIEITDTGKGIHPDELEKIFDALYTTKPTGTGLGLPYCKSVIEQHGGSIAVSRDPTRFTIILPK